MRPGGDHCRVLRTRFPWSGKSASRLRSGSSALRWTALAPRPRHQDRVDRWRCDQYRPSRTSYLVGLPRLGIERATQSAVQAINCAVSTIGRPDNFVALGEVLRQGGG